VRAHYGIDQAVSLWGGYGGRLSDSGEPLRLLRPGTPSVDEAESLSRLLEDEVLYDDLAPWPVQSDGGGASLTRVAVEGWGSDPSSWAASAPSPGVVDLTVSLPGDSNGDGVFDQRDLRLAAEAGKYLTSQPAARAEGDWNGDGVFDQLDIVLALQTGRYAPDALASLRLDALALPRSVAGVVTDAARGARLLDTMAEPTREIDDYFADYAWD
jgi:hypothetical protein